jgi:hypothetical protein
MMLLDTSSTLYCIFNGVVVVQISVAKTLLASLKIFEICYGDRLNKYAALINFFRSSNKSVASGSLLMRRMWLLQLDTEIITTGYK